MQILKGSSSEHLVVIVLHLPSSLGHYCESKNETEKPTRSSRIFPVFLGVAETIRGYFFFFFALIHGFKLTTEQPQDSHNRQYNFYRQKHLKRIPNTFPLFAWSISFKAEFFQ